MTGDDVSNSLPPQMKSKFRHYIQTENRSTNRQAAQVYKLHAM